MRRNTISIGSLFRAVEGELIFADIATDLAGSEDASKRYTGPVSAPSIPQRIQPLAWRAPAILWIPLALGLAICWPLALFIGEPDRQRVALAVGASQFVLSLLSLGVSWLRGHAPEARRIVVAHVVVAGAAASLAAPVMLSKSWTLASVLTVAPLAIVLGLPAALISGLIFAWLALTPPPPARIQRAEVQPFA